MKTSNQTRLSPRIGIIFCVLWALLVAILFSDAGVSIAAIYISLLFTVVWLILWTVRLIKYWRHSRQVERNTAFLAAFWSFEPLMFLLIAALAYSGALMQARFRFSQSALNQYTNDVSDGKIAVDFDFVHPVKQLGLYSIGRTQKLPNGGVEFITSDDGLFDQAGFAYIPDANPPVKSKNSYKHISDSWWLWKEKF